MAIDTWMPTLKEILAEIEGIEQVHTYDELPGSLMAFPCLVIMPESGSQSYGMSAPGIAIHRVKVTLYVASVFMPEAMGKAVPFIELIRDKLAAHMNLEGMVSYCLPVNPPDAFYEGPNGLSYGDKVHTGINFYLVVKEVESFTVS